MKYYEKRILGRTLRKWGSITCQLLSVCAARRSMRVGLFNPETRGWIGRQTPWVISPRKALCSARRKLDGLRQDYKQRPAAKERSLPTSRIQDDGGREMSYPQRLTSHRKERHVGGFFTRGRVGVADGWSNQKSTPSDTLDQIEGTLPSSA